MRIGLVGCGNISSVYFNTIRHRFGEVLDVVCCTDADSDRARAASVEHGIGCMESLEELLSCDEVETVLNLTPPSQHYGVSLQALRAGKHLYSEKPLCLTTREGKELLELASAQNLRIGVAPDTFLGNGIQATKKVVDSGEIGRVFAAHAWFSTLGPESWHPNPAFFYQKGAGPLFDMGPYYITALVEILGPVKRVVAAASIPREVREYVQSDGRSGAIQVDVPTSVWVTLDFEDDIVCTLFCSFDVANGTVPNLQLFGTEGAVTSNDPNRFSGEILVHRNRDPEIVKVCEVNPYCENLRGLGLAEMALALRNRTPHRASGDLGFHVLDVLESILISAENGEWLDIGSTAPRSPGLYGSL